MKNLILLTLILFNNIAFAQNAPSQKAYQPPVSLLENGGFESGKAGWTNSGGTFAIVTSGSNLLWDKASATFDASSSGQYIQSKLYTVPVGLYGGNCAASIDYLGGDTNLKLVALDGSANVLATRTFESAATEKRSFGISFPCPSSGTFRIRLESLANAAIVAVDKAKLGEFDTVQIGTPKLYGTLRSEAVTNCEWQITVGNVALANFPADTDCNNPTVTGEVTAPGTKVPGLVVQGPGDFLITMQGKLRHNSAADGTYTIRLSNGTQHSNVAEGVLIDTSGFSAATTGGTYTFSITLPTGSHTLQLQGSTFNATLSLNNTTGADQTGLNFVVYKYPSQQEVGFRADTVAWLVDSNIVGAAPSLGTSAQTAYVGITDSGLAAVQNSGSIGVQIPCSSTNPSTGLTCAAGDESVGVVFNAPTAGAVEACVAFAYYSNSGNASPQTTFQIVETPNNAQTILQEGKDRTQAGVTSQEGIFPFKTCGIFQFTSAGQKTLRLMYEMPAKTNAPLVFADADANQGQRDIHWTVKPLNQQVPAPLLVNTIVSPYAGITKVIATEFGDASNGSACTGSPCTKRNDSGGGFGTITRSGAGTYVVNFAETFAAVPVCTCNAYSTGAAAHMCVITEVTTTQINELRGYDHANNLTDSEIQVVCVGPKQ